MKILLVEDDANLREVTQRSLEKERYVVEIAADYRTALQKIEDYDYDCILLDILLPLAFMFLGTTSGMRSFFQPKTL